MKKEIPRQDVVQVVGGTKTQQRKHRVIDKKL